MVAAQQEECLGVVHLEREQVQHHLAAEAAPVHVVAQEQILSVLRVAAHLEQADEVEELPVQVAAHSDGILELQHVGLVAQQHGHAADEVAGQLGGHAALALEVLFQHGEVGQPGALVDQLVALHGEHGRRDDVFHDAVHLHGSLLVVRGGRHGGGGGGGGGHGGTEDKGRGGEGKGGAREQTARTGRGSVCARTDEVRLIYWVAQRSSKGSSDDSAMRSQYDWASELGERFERGLPSARRACVGQLSANCANRAEKGVLE